MIQTINIVKELWKLQADSDNYVAVSSIDDKARKVNHMFAHLDETDKLIEYLEDAQEHNLSIHWYPVPFIKRSTKKTALNPEGTPPFLWGDYDEGTANIPDNLEPSIMWTTSAGRAQALWLLSDTANSVSDFEQVNKALAKATGGDTAVFRLNHSLRVPGTLNFKYDPPFQGEITTYNTDRIYSFERLRSLLCSDTSDSLSDLSVSPELLDLITTSADDIEKGNRSETLWYIVTSAFEQGCSVKDVLTIVDKTAWNKFRGRPDEQTRVLEIVLKAQEHVDKRKKDLAHTPIEWAVPYSDFIKYPYKSPEWLIEGIWQQGTYGMIAGEPKTYKSIQVTDMALSIASGTPYLDHFPVKHTGTVLYIQEENSANTVQDRLYKIAHNKGLLTGSSSGLTLIDNLPLYVCNNYGINLTTRASRELLESTIQSVEPNMVILDPLYRMFGATDENSASEVGEILNWLTSLRNKYAINLVVIHHYNKGSSAQRGGQRIRGSGSFHAWVECAQYVKVTATAHTVDIEREFRAFSNQGDFTLRVELGEPGQLFYKPTVTFKNLAKDTYEEDITHFLAQRKCTLSELMRATGVSKSTCLRQLKELAYKGRIIAEQQAKGRGKETYYSLSGVVYDENGEAKSE